jgi:hypothetical protein
MLFTYRWLKGRCYDDVAAMILFLVQVKSHEWIALPQNERRGWRLTDSRGQTIWIADAHRDDGKRFIVHADEKLTAFLELLSGDSRFPQ